MTPPQITYTPKTTMTMEKKQHLKLYECCICHQKWSFSISTLVYWRVINFTWIKFQQKTCNLDQQIQLFEESFKNDMFLWFRHQPQGSLSVFHLFLPRDSQGFLLELLATITRKQSFCCFHQLPKSAKAASFYPSGHLYGCKAKVGPWISTAFGQSHGQLRMCSRGFGDHRGTWRFLVLERWWAAFWCGRKLMVWYDSGGARGFPKILDILAESVF